MAENRGMLSANAGKPQPGSYWGLKGRPTVAPTSREKRARSGATRQLSEGHRKMLIKPVLISLFSPDGSSPNRWGGPGEPWGPRLRINPHESGRHDIDS